MVRSEDVMRRNALMDRYFQLEEGILDGYCYNVKKIPEPYRRDLLWIRGEVGKNSQSFPDSDGALRSINISLAYYIERLELIQENYMNSFREGKI